MSKPKDRRFEMTLDIEAPPDAVWKALADAEELVRWFPLRAEVEPREGGRYLLSWNDRFESDGRITLLEPERHLRTTWPSQPPGSGPVELAVDFFLESAAGKTTLRVVHSGFGQGANWDEEFDGVRIGWNYELRSLRHYLERHRGQRRHVAYVVSEGQDPDGRQLWDRLLRDGFGQPGAFDGLAEGDRYTFDARLAQPLAGSVVNVLPQQQFAGTVEALDDALFRIEIWAGRVNLWLSVWGEDASAVDLARERWRDLLEQLLPAA